MSNTVPLLSLYKTRTFITNLANNFTDFTNIGEITRISKQLIPFKGQLGIKVYVKNMPKNGECVARQC